jgi:Leucine-rich repeat (LRR) protein
MGSALSIVDGHLEYTGTVLKNFDNIQELGGVSLNGVVSVNVSNNQLEDIRGIQKLAITLKELNLSYNPLKTLSDDVSLLQNLKCLKLSNCGLIELNPKIGHLVQLCELDVSNNSLKTLPGGAVKTLKSLETLNLSFNQLESLPGGTDIC